MDINRITLRRPKNIARAIVSLACIVLMLSINMPIAVAATPESPARQSKQLPKPGQIDVKTGDHKLKSISVKSTLSSNPTDTEITAARLFHEPLIPMSVSPVKGENAALATAVNSFKRNNNIEEVSSLTQFLEQFPQSRWSPSLKTNLAKIRFMTGYLSDALILWSQAWDESKKETANSRIAVANNAFANLVLLEARLGMRSQLRSHLKEVKGRPFFGSDEEKIDGVHSGLWEMDNRPQCAFKCGPWALNSVYNLGKKDRTVHPLIEKADSTTEGTDMVQLRNWAKQIGLDYKIVKRSPGGPIVTPSVMHWKVGHFAALTGVEKGKYRVEDPTFDSDAHNFISQRCIDSEADYFLVPATSQLASAYTPVSDSEARTIKGKGWANVWGGLFTRKPGRKQCFRSQECCEGMAQAEAWTMLGTLNIEDVPLGYSPPLGPSMDFRIVYNHEQTDQPGSFAFSNLGFNWNCPWLAYLTLNGSNVATVRVPGGGAVLSTPSAGIYPADFLDQSVLVDMGSGVYERHLTDGSVEVYNLSDSSSPARIFMTEFRDPQGNSVLIQYDSDFRITQVTDASNQVSTYSYVSNTFGNAGFYKLASITDPFGRFCTFTYDSTTTRLIKITDVVGLESSFTYDTSSSFITTLTNPYGTTSFYKYVPSTNPVPVRGLKATFPDGSTSVIESWIGPTQSTYYWDRQAMELYPNDPQNKVYTHCSKAIFWQVNQNTHVMQDSPQTVTYPLESQPLVYYYSGTLNNYYSGTFNLPQQVSRPLGSTPANHVVNLTIAGTPNVGKVATITASWDSVYYTVVSGDTTTTMATKIAELINNNTTYRSRGITAGATKNVVSMYSDGNVHWYNASVSSGSTFTLSLLSQARQTQTLTYGGTMGSGVTVYLYVNYPTTNGGRLTAQYTTQPGDTFGTVATNIASQVNADATCQQYNVTAVVDGSSILLTSYSPEVQTYGHATTGMITGVFTLVRNGAVDTVNYERNAIGKVIKSVDQANRTLSYSYDTNNIDLLEVRETQRGNNYLLGHWEYNSQHLPLKYIDGSAREWDYVYNAVGQPVSVTDPASNTTTMTYTGTATATIGGSVTTSDILTITVHDADLSGGLKAKSYTVQGGDTLTTIATALKNAINSDTDLSGIGVTATSSGAVITISSTSVEVTSYTKSTSGGATETITLTANRLGFLTKIDGPLTGNQDVTTFSYDNYNRLFTQTDSEGYTLTFFYDDMNRPVKTVYPDGTFEETKWDRLDAVLVSDRNGRWTQRAYNSMMELIYEIDPLGRKTQYGWCSCGSLSTLIDPNGNTTEWHHDLQGRVTSKVYEDSTTISYLYQSRNSRLKSTTDALGQIKTFFYNSDGRLYQYNFTSPVNATPASTFFWDYNFPRMTGSQKNDWGGYTYSYNNYVTSSGATPITGGGMLSTVQNDVIANSDITYSYDSLGRTTNRSIDGANNSCSWTYDPMSRITSETNELGNFDYAYVDDAPSASKGTTRLASITYPNSQVTKFSYFDNVGDQRLQQISNLNPSGTTLSQFNYRYDPAGQITQWQQIQNNTSTNYGLGYDKAGQLVSAQASGGVLSPAYLKQYHYAYDPGSNRSAVHTNSVTRAKIGGTVTTSDALTITVFDAALTGGSKAVNYVTTGGDTLSTIATKLAAAITADSDLQTLGVNASANGSTISIKSASRNITTYTRATSGGATETIALNVTDNFVENAVIGGSKTTSDVLTITVIDPALGTGKKNISYTVQSGDTLSSIATGLKNAINADSSLMTIGVSATSVGTVITIKSTSDNATTYDQSVSNGATETISLSVNQNSVESIAIGGTKTTSDTITVVVYDSELPGGSDSTVYTVQSGDTLSTIASGIATALNADADLQNIGLSAAATGKVITLRSNSPNPTSYRTTTSSSATETATIGIPANGVQTAVIGGSKTTSDVLTITVHDPGLPGGSKAIAYNVLGGDTLTSIAAGLATAINADPDLQGQGVTATSSSTVLNIASASVNLTTYTKSLSGGATETITLAPGINVTQYGHNNVNELTSIASGGATRFHGNSNKGLSSATVNSNPVPMVWGKEFSGNETLSAGSNNIPVAITDGASNTKTNNYQVTVNSGSSATLTYDANGNMTGDGTNTYVWDADNRLIQINYPGMGNFSQFTVDPMSRNVRILEVSGGSTTSTKQFIWTGGARSEERNTSGSLIKQYFSLGQTNSGTGYFFTLDHIGSIREMSDNSGNIQAQYSFDPFGRIAKLQGNLSADFQYAGYYLHAPTGLSLTVYRAYSADLARWINRDPIGESEGLNLMQYCRNAPVAGIDPTGLRNYPVGTPVNFVDPVTGNRIPGAIGPDGISHFPGWINCAGFACGQPDAIMPPPGKPPSWMFKKLGYKCYPVKNMGCCDKRCPPLSGRVMVFSSAFSNSGGEVHVFGETAGGWISFPGAGPTGSGWQGYITPAIPDPFNFDFEHPEKYKKAYCCCKM